MRLVKRASCIGCLSFMSLGCVDIKIPDQYKVNTEITTPDLPETADNINPFALKELFRENKELTRQNQELADDNKRLREKTTSSEAASPPPQHAYERTSVRVRWLSDGGRVFAERENKQWSQTLPNGDYQYPYKFVESTEDYIELHSKSGKYRYRLYETEVWQIYPGVDSWVLEAKGRWVIE